MDFESDMPTIPTRFSLLPHGKLTRFTSDGEEEERGEKEEKEEKEEEVVPIAEVQASSGGMGALFEESSAKNFSLFNFFPAVGEGEEKDQGEEKEGEEEEEREKMNMNMNVNVNTTSVEESGTLT